MMLMKKLLVAALVAGTALPLAQSAQAVEKTAIDRRLNTPMDVDIQALDIFVGSLIDRIKVDLGTKITRLTAEINLFDQLSRDVNTHINNLRANYTICPHAEAPVTVPESASYDTTRNRLQWTGVRWQTQPTQDWEHD